MSFAALDELHTAAGGARQAALVLHAMSAGDRTWVLAQLPAPQQQMLGGLLGELAQLGIPADPGLVSQALARAPAAPAHAQDASGLSPSAAVAQHPSGAGNPDEEALVQLGADRVALLATALQQEPVQLVAKCLKLKAWPWQQSLLDALPVAHRQQVKEAMERPGASVAGSLLARALMQGMRQRSQPVAGASPAHYRQAVPLPAPKLRGRLPWLSRVIRPMGGDR